jgi:uncharacterized membrane protein
MATRCALGMGREVAVADEREVAVAGAREGDESTRVLLERLHDPARVLALSDGVFAIIITLLVLEIHIPELTQGHSLNEALRELRPSLVAFVISFILAGMYWVGHRDLFALIRRTDRGLVWLNILFLLPLCLLPFGAGLLGRYDQEPVALRIYGLVLVAIAVMRVVIWLYATNRPHLLWQRLDDRQRRAGLAVNLGPRAGLPARLSGRQGRAGGEPADLRRLAGAVLPQHHRPAQRPSEEPGVRGVHLTHSGASASEG